MDRVMDNMRAIGKTMLNKETVTFKYKNWKGEVRDRVVKPIQIWKGSTEYHEEEQWLLMAKDLEKNAYRHFALADIMEVY